MNKVEQSFTQRPVQSPNLTQTDKAKIIGIKVAKVAVGILTVAAVAAAAYFLSPILISAGVALFSASLAGLVGGSALLAAIEHVAFKKLNQMEKKILDSYIVLPNHPLKTELEKQINDKMNGNKNGMVEAVGVDYGKRGWKSSFDGVSAESFDDFKTSLSALNESTETQNTICALSQQAIATIASHILLYDENKKRLFPEKDSDCLMPMPSSFSADYIATASHDSKKRETTTQFTQRMGDILASPDGPVAVGTVQITSVVNWDDCDKNTVTLKRVS